MILTPWLMEVLTRAKSAALAQGKCKHRATFRPLAEKEDRPEKDRFPTFRTPKGNTSASSTLPIIFAERLGVSQ
jgi:hypothetical protein